MPSIRQDTQRISGRQPEQPKKPAIPGASRRQALLPSLLLSPFCALATINHLFDLWARSRLVQAGLFSVFTLAWLFLLIFLLRWLLPIVKHLKPGSRALPLLAALAVTAFTLSQLPPDLTPHPPSMHSLQIFVPGTEENPGGIPGEVRLVEFIGPDEQKQPLHLFEQRGEWTTSSDGSLAHTSGQPGELFYSFYGKWNQPVELMFQASPEGGKALVILDGKRLPLDLRDSYANNRVVPLTTGSTRPLWNILLPAADFTVLFVLALSLTGLLVLLSKRPALGPLLNAGEGIPALLLYLLSAALGSAYIQQVRLSNLIDVRPLEYSNLVFGLVFGLVILAAYAVLRLGMSRTWAFLGAVAFLTSPLHLYALTMLHREYIRAFFTLAALFFTGSILLGKNTTPRPSPDGQGLAARRLFLLSALTGSMIGWGLHYRQDLLLYFVPYLVLVLFFLPGYKGKDIVLKLSAVALCLAAVYAAQFLAGGSFNLDRTAVAAIGGLMEPLTHKMAVQDPIYNLGSIWVMEYADSVPILHRDLLGAATNYIQADILTFPADILLRAYVSVLQVLDLPFIFVLPPLGVDSSVVNVFYQARAALLNFPPGAGAILAAVSLLVLAARDLRKAIFYAFLVVFLCAYPAVDFQARHFFQLQMFTWFNLGFLLDRLVRIAHKLVSPSRQTLRQALGLTNQELKSLPLRLGGFTFGGLALLVLLLLAARSLQANTVTKMLQRYEAAPRQEILLTLQPLEGGYSLWTNPQVFARPPSAGVTYGKLLAAEFDPSRCDFTTLWPRIQYNFDTASIRGTRQELSYLTRIDLDPAKGKTTYYFQAVFANSSAGWQGYPGYSYFAGVRLPSSASTCLTSISEVTAPAENPILLNAVLSNGWQNTPLYQRSLLLEGGKPGDTGGNAGKVIAITPQQAAYTEYPLEFGDNGQWLVDGYTIPPQGTAAMEKIAPYSVYGILLETEPVQLKPGDIFTARGQVYAGGALFELLQDGTVHDRFLVTGPVPFTVRLAAQVEGAYTLRLSAHIDKFSSYETRLKVENPAWIIN